MIIYLDLIYWLYWLYWRIYLNWNCILNTSLYIASHIVCLNIFTLHFLNENVLICNEVFSETHGRLRTLQRRDLRSTSLRLSRSTWIFFCLGTSSRLASHVICLNTFTINFPNENVLQSQYSLKWWKHSLISRLKTFSRVTNLLWNDEYIHSFPDRKHVGFEYIHSSFPNRKRSPE